MSVSDLLVPCIPYVRIPTTGDYIHKDECCISFETPESEDGLFICLNTFLGFSKKYLPLYHSVTNHKLFLHIKKIKKVIPPTTTEEAPTEKKPKRLAIGIEGGFDPDKDGKVEHEQIETLTVMPDFHEISFDSLEDIHSLILASVSGVLSSTSASNKEDIMAWDGEVRPVTKHGASLEQLSNGVKVPPSGWKCCKCDLTTNLWMNLSDGSILCGRRYFDGSGGNNHAIDHFKETKFPLAVKLGTITPSGADVHSYDEDTMVEDPYLAKHLAHFGINMMNMEKTDQTMTEMEIELNQKVGNEWDLIQEAGENLKELHGAGLTGMTNMGNTCYLNSTVQVLLSIPEFQQVYANQDNFLEMIRKKLLSLNPHGDLSRIGDKTKVSQEIQKRVEDLKTDFSFQMSKLALALNYQETDSDQSKDTEILLSTAPMPRTLKRIIGKGHSEFCTNKQQDAHEFLLHILSIMERSEHKNGATLPPGDAFKFMVEERLECQQSKQVRYSKHPDYIFSLPILCDMATNKDDLKAYEERKEKNKADVKFDVGEVVRAKIPFQACLNQFAQDEFVPNFWSSALKEKAVATKRTRFLSFPDYLVVQLKKFTVGEDWIPKKLDVSIDMPELLDLNEYRGTGIQPGETPLPDIDPPSQQTNTAPPMEVDEEAVLAISQMGFPMSRCRDAIVATGNTGVEPAVMWLMENNSSEPVSAQVAVSESGPPDESIAMIIGMGFTREQSIKALRATGNNVERAVDWIFNHMDDMDTQPSAATGDESSVSAGVGEGGDTVGPKVKDGSGKYKLFAFISHMGTSTMCGHYVCHIKKDGRWVIFNDEKVAESKHPPISLGYIYFYKRYES
uniref:Ubiquitin carboxyl-terminal hydrolase n=1 Tax=Phallusia mammillata TaxID=59560 RepID=A0A6F9DVT2_9ASCI|nr:ubiquitin carboxyl-terminal hydrolase 5 [Phallusia mammillata]